MSEERPAGRAPDAWAQAVRMLERRDYSRRALLDKLIAAGAPPPQAQEAVERAASLGYLDDARLARAVARTRATVSRWGRKRILLDLRRRGLDEDVATRALDDVEAELAAAPAHDGEGEGERDPEPDGWAGPATEALRRRFGTWTALEPKERQRRVAFLLRRGYDYDQARAALDATRAAD